MFKIPMRLTGLFAAGAAVLLVTGCGTAAGAGQTDDGFTVGMTLPTAQNSTIEAIADGLRAEVENAGGKLVTADSQLQIDKQISDIDMFISEEVDAIVVFPLDFPTLKNVLERADKAGIALFAHDALMTNATPETLSPVRAQVVTGRSQQAKEAADFIEQQTGGTGKVAAIGIAAPVNTNIFLLDRFSQQVKQRPNLELVGQKGNPTDDAAGARPLAEGFLTQHPDLSAVFTYNDPSAIGAAAAAAAAGKDVVVTGFNASQDGLDAVKSGAIDATWDYKPVEIGQTLGRLAIESAVKGNEVGLNYQMDVAMVTKKNVDSFVPWDDRVRQIEDGKYLGLPIE